MNVNDEAVEAGARGYYYDDEISPNSLEAIESTDWREALHLPDIRSAIENALPQVDDKTLLQLPRVQKLMATVWKEGYTSGHSRAMRHMSDEPNVKPGVNPYE